MKIKIQLFTSCALSLVLTIFLCQCKSPDEKKETAMVSKADSTTAAAQVDTAQTATTPATDTAKVQVPLTLVIKNLRSATAPVIVGLYDSMHKFPDPADQLKVYQFTPNGKELTATITDQKFGVYAMAIYQDVNSNGKIDKNFVGIPTEPYAFSQNYVPKIKAPNFNDCKFTYDSKSNSMTMTMSK